MPGKLYLYFYFYIINMNLYYFGSFKILVFKAISKPFFLLYCICKYGMNESPERNFCICTNNSYVWTFEWRTLTFFVQKKTFQINFVSSEKEKKSFSLWSKIVLQHPCSVCIEVENHEWKPSVKVIGRANNDI